MVRMTLRHRPGDGPRPGSGAPAGSRAPAAPSPREPNKRLGSAPRRRRRVLLPASAGAAAAITLAACTLLAPGFVLGAEDPTGDYATLGALLTPAVEPEVSGATPNVPTPPTAEETTALDEKVVTGDAAATSAKSAAVVSSGGELLVTLPWGSDPGEVGLLDPGEGLARGPEALAAAPDGRIVVLDSVNSRLLFLEPSGEPVGTASISLASPRFLAVDNSTIYVLDCDTDHRLASFDWSGAAMGSRELPHLEDVVTGLFATDQGPCLEIAHETVLLLAQTAQTLQASAGRSGPARVTTRVIAGRPMDRRLGHAAQVTFRPGGGVGVKYFQLDNGSLRAVQTHDSSPTLAAGHAIEHLVSVDGDGAGGLIIGARLLRLEAAEGRNASLALTLVASAKDDGLPDTIFLADSPFAYLGQPYVVAPDGRILQPWGDENGYSILIHSFAEAAEVKL